MDESTSTVRYDDGNLADAASAREARARRYIQALLAFCRRYAGVLIVVLIAGTLADIIVKKTTGFQLFFISFVTSAGMLLLIGFALFREGRAIVERLFLERFNALANTSAPPKGEYALEWGRALDGTGLWLGPEGLSLVADPGERETYPWSEVRLETAKVLWFGTMDLIVHLPHRRLRYSGDKLGLSAAEIIARASRLHTAEQ